MEEKGAPHEGVTMKSCSNADNPLTLASQGITINEKIDSSSSTRKRTRDEATVKMRVKEIQKDQKRTEKMRLHYSTLQSMVPHLFPKVTRERIMDETISYIRQLERDLKSLQDRKADAELIYPRTHQNSSMEVNVSGNVALFGIRAMMKRPGLAMESVFRVFEEHKVEVLAASVAVKDRMLSLTITALNGDGEGDGDDKINTENQRTPYPRS
ncbi:uncharacterized protein LOC122669549 [Telopea speciosissima]|uniref:uncharacterized protein LOC122669549 n=1 Tax=Telopea speciosissima TaxID=54955 RepID=UPI001CC3D3E5|nr:uncharacterized protein LOC122669549 [Telopea speciosissima]